MITADRSTGLYTGHHAQQASVPSNSEFVGQRGYEPGQAETGFQKYDWTIIPDPDWVFHPDQPVQPDIETGWVDNSANLGKYKEDAYTKVGEELAVRVEAAETTPVVGVDYSASPSKRDRANKKRDNLASKKVNGVSDADDHLMDHIDLLHNFAETQEDAIESAGNYDAVDVIIDGLDSAAWPTWAPIS